ncbi:hypothetical protein D0Z00_004131 [Geotrichum galactomycetum]|uniref:Uncharacterized protein n=1 Tax=Geotrichum galactomycetum TaxID=27317 RepID=A0ACB6UZA9_9ASCO|nr:hypothetical protein D0Z00_004131 [Geotrichum candidum]
MFKKVVTSVKTAWNTAVEEFEQDKSNGSKVLDDITNSVADEPQEQQRRHQIHRRYGSRHNLLKRKATLNNDLENLSLGSKQEHKRRRFFSDLKKSVSCEALSRRNSLSISAALPAERGSELDLADEVGSITTVAASPAPDLASLSSASSASPVEELKIRIHELETLVAQKDHIIKILREELTNQHAKALVTPHHRTSSRRPDVSFEVLSPIAIDLDKFISTNDPKSLRANSAAAAGSAAPIEQESQPRPMGNH